MSANNQVDSDDGDVENNTQKKKVYYIKKVSSMFKLKPINIRWI